MTIRVVTVATLAALLWPGAQDAYGHDRYSYAQIHPVYRQPVDALYRELHHVIPPPPPPTRPVS